MTPAWWNEPEEQSVSDGDMNHLGDEEAEAAEREARDRALEAAADRRIAAWKENGRVGRP